VSVCLIACVYFALSAFVFVLPYASSSNNINTNLNGFCALAKAARERQRQSCCHITFVMFVSVILNALKECLYSHKYVYVQNELLIINNSITIYS